MFDQRAVRLRDFRDPGTTLTYIYDFGDEWSHAIEIEERLALDIAPIRARCVDGARARPPEDVGGIPGYEHFLAVIGNPKDFEDAQHQVLCGGHFDPDWFDLPTVDKDVRNALKPNVRRRLHQIKPKPHGHKS